MTYANPCIRTTRTANVLGMDAFTLIYGADGKVNYKGFTEQAEAIAFARSLDLDSFEVTDVNDFQVYVEWPQIERV